MASWPPYCAPINLHRVGNPISVYCAVRAVLVDQSCQSPRCPGPAIHYHDKSPRRCNLNLIYHRAPLLIIQNEKWPHQHHTHTGPDNENLTEHVHRPLEIWEKKICKIISIRKSANDFQPLKFAKTSLHKNLSNFCVRKENLQS